MCVQLFHVNISLPVLYTSFFRQECLIILYNNYLDNEPITESRHCLFSYKTDSLLRKIFCSFRIFCLNLTATLTVRTVPDRP
jgi:hypothetical protein